MKSFSDYLKTSPVDKFSDDNSVVSETGFERFLSEQLQFQDYCVIIPKKTDIDNEIRECFSKYHLGLYPLSVSIGKTNDRIYILTKKPSMSVTEFKNIISESYSASKNFDFLYKEFSTVKKICEETVTEIKNVTINKPILEHLIETITNKKTKIYGIEVPLHANMKSEYRKNNLLSFNLTSLEFGRAKKWSDLKR